jgi:hypothetical protein
MKRISTVSWFVGVSEIKASLDPRVTLHEAASDDDMVALLEQLGCSEVELVDDGCASARIPLDWVRALKREGGSTRRATLPGGRRFMVNIDLP